jgi:hypothetical protein
MTASPHSPYSTKLIALYFKRQHQNTTLAKAFGGPKNSFVKALLSRQSSQTHKLGHNHPGNDWRRTVHTPDGNRLTSLPPQHAPTDARRMVKLVSIVHNRTGRNLVRCETRIHSVRRIGLGEGKLRGIETKQKLIILSLLLIVLVNPSPPMFVF